VIDDGLFHEMNVAQPQIQASTYPYWAVKVRTERRESDIGMVSNGNIYGPIQVSTDAYLKILTERERNCENSTMRPDRDTLDCRTRK
jgi:hypothetical protein